jgi:Tfp pilus assembly protein PilF
VEDPQDLEVLATIGIAFTEMGEHDEGYSMLKRSFALNREDYRTLYGLAYAETTVHRYEAAAARLHDRLEKDLPESFKKLAEMSLERLSAVL